MSAFTVRKARMEDVPAMHGLLLASARQGLLLPRALIHLYGHVRNFMVAADAAGRTVGCCALAPVGKIWPKSVLWWCRTTCAVRAWGGCWSGLVWKKARLWA